MKRPVLVDTQLLVLLTVGVTDWRLIERHKRTRDAYTRSDFHLLLDLLGHDPRFVFCAHVAAETSNLVGQYREPDRSRLMSVLQTLLNNSKEPGIACQAAMEEQEFLPLGLADAAQLVLCTGETVLLSDDELLVRAAAARGLKVVYFYEERRLRNQSRVF